jgi:hypothetical protein
MVVPISHLDADGKEFCIAGIRSVVPEDQGSVGALPENLMHQAELDLPETATTKLDGEVGRPQSSLLDLLLEWLDHGRHLVVGKLKSFDRKDLVTDESAHPLKLLFELWFGLEVPGHVASSSSGPLGPLPCGCAERRSLHSYQ